MKNILRLAKKIILLPFEDIRATIKLRNWLLEVVDDNDLKGYGFNHIRVKQSESRNRLKRRLNSIIEIDDGKRVIKYRKKIAVDPFEEFPSLELEDVNWISGQGRFTFFVGIFKLFS